MAATSYEEAERKAVAERNDLNDYGPDEDSGYVAIDSYTRDDLLALIKQMGS